MKESLFNADFYQSNLQEYHDPLMYDLENQWAKDDDFFLEMVQKYGGTVLDIGCGTGRLTRAIARLGIQITGIDISLPMLKHAKILSKNLNISWFHADARTFNLSQQHDLVLMTSHGFQHLLTQKDQIDFFNNVHQHLNKNGILIFDTRNFQYKNYRSSQKMEYRRTIENHHNEKIKIYLQTEYNIETELDYIQIKKENINTQKIIHSEIYLKYTEVKKLNQILEKCNFEIIHQYGDWDKSFFQETSPEIISICKKV